jgi:hypothetical protein
MAVSPAVGHLWRIDSPAMLSPVPHPLLFLISTSLKVELNMKDRTETLEIARSPRIFRWARPIARALFTLDGCWPGRADSRVSARHLVTELREAHDSVRVAGTGE